MAERFTRRDAEEALRVYCTRSGRPYGHYLAVCDDLDGAPAREIPEEATLLRLNSANGRRTYVLTGGLALDCAYGGYQVQEIIGGEDACTGVRTPFGGGYRTAREITLMLRGAIAGLEMTEDDR